MGRRWPQFAPCCMHYAIERPDALWQPLAQLSGATCLAQMQRSFVSTFSESGVDVWEFSFSMRSVITTILSS